jgi:hypothetical protein
VAAYLKCYIWRNESDQDLSPPWRDSGLAVPPCPPLSHQCAVQLCDVGSEEILPSARTVKAKRSLPWRINKYEVCKRRVDW